MSNGVSMQTNITDNSSSAFAKLVSRRRFCFLAAAGAASLAGLSLSGCSKAADDAEQNRLNIFSWADYLHPDCIPNFEKRYQVRVVYDTFSGNEQLLAKMQAGATEYDIVMPSNYMVQELNKLGLLQVLEHDRLKGLNLLMERFQSPGYDKGLVHSVPQFWGTTGIASDTTGLGSVPVPDDWDAFWDKRFAGRMTLLDDGRETIGMSLKRQGKSYNSTNPAEVRAATQELIKQKPLVMCYTSDQVIVQLAAGDSMLAMVYSGDAYQAAKQNKNVRYRIPRSGASVWVDSFCIPKTAPHKVNAYRWLNYMLEPEVAAQNATFTRYATANLAARKFIVQNDLDDPDRYPSDSILSHCEELQDLGQGIFLFDRMWTELKCS
jgi:spermidine/putrescine transport system substrate-binding protein